MVPSTMGASTITCWQSCNHNTLYICGSLKVCTSKQVCTCTPSLSSTRRILARSCYIMQQFFGAHSRWRHSLNYHSPHIIPVQRRENFFVMSGTKKMAEMQLFCISFDMSTMHCINIVPKAPILKLWLRHSCTHVFI